MTAHFSKARNTWAEGTCEPERFVGVGDSVVAFVHVRVRLKGSTDWIEGRLADVYRFRDGKVIRGRSFLDAQEVRGISRVVYDISGKPPATIEWG